MKHTFFILSSNISSKQDRAPPPASYGIPDEKFVEKHWQQGTNIPSFEWNQGPRSLPLEVK